MGNSLSAVVQGRNLLAAISHGDVLLVQQILDANVELAFYAPIYQKRSPLALAAERGDLEVVRLLHQAAVRAEPDAKLCLDSLGAKMRTPLMSACMHGHLECVEYLLYAGADATTVTFNVRRETALHLAAQHSHADCASSLLESSVVLPGGAMMRLGNTISVNAARFVDATNGAGLTALHIATLNGSAATVRALVRGGAALDSQVAGGRSRPASNWMCAGSTALHLACARGLPNVATALLEAQATRPGLTDLRRIRNCRGLKPSQCARLEGHHDLARLLHHAPPPPGLLGSRRSRRAAAELRAAAPNLEALMQLLVSRAKLLLSLRAIVQQQKGTSLPEDDRLLPAGGVAGLAPAADGPSLSEGSSGRRRHQRSGSRGSSGSAAVDILQLLATLDFQPAQPDAEARVSVGAAAAAAHAAEVAPGAEPTAADGRASSGRTYRSYAASALMQAALDAIEQAARAGPDGLSDMDPLPATASGEAPSVAAFDVTLAPELLVAAAAESMGGSSRSSHRRRRRRAVSLEELFPPGQGEELFDPQRDHGDFSWLPSEALGPTLLQRLRIRHARRRRRRSNLPPAAEDVALAAAFDSATAQDMSVADGVAIPPGGSARRLRSPEQTRPTGLAPPSLQHISSRSLAAARSDSGARPPSGSAPAAAPAGGTAGAGGPAAGSAQVLFGGASGSLPAAAAAAGSAPPASEIEPISPMDSQASLARTTDSASSASEDEDDMPKPVKVRWATPEEAAAQLGGSDAGGPEGEGACAICMDARVEAAAGGCGHGLCVRCAYQLCARGLALPACPFCRAPIGAFEPVGTNACAAPP